MSPFGASPSRKTDVAAHMHLLDAAPGDLHERGLGKLVKEGNAAQGLEHAPHSGQAATRGDGQHARRRSAT